MTKMSKILAGALALSALASHQTAMAQDKCVTTEEAKAVATVVMPGIVTSLADSCKSTLPDTAALSQSSTFVDEVLAPAARTAFPSAFQTFRSAFGDGLPEGLGYDDMAPLMDAFIGQEVAKGVKPESCGAINALFETVQTMTPDQTSSLLVGFFQLVATAEEDPTKDLPFNVCPVTVSE
ncbi:hypothetical protein [Alterisphingorhabdus coralli]|uniref:Secreted protein n=1 Tax=Alterisphingorhabdus coralli TaxID=3071408 RepID=A0AA97HZP5_9SPHN|nr:hypothetical protein [Parasphingorhabdus sp. SCSIO 66989]WOE74057.1 hypothetical protein RB602_09305 [Parasphingorhabdus sp. SCSIO 66989]